MGTVLATMLVILLLVAFWRIWALFGAAVLVVVALLTVPVINANPDLAGWFVGFLGVAFVLAIAATYQSE